MKQSSIYRYPLRLNRADKKNVDAVARESGSTINQVLITSIRKGLPLAREALRQGRGRIANVDPLPDEIWRRIYCHEDEMDSVSAHDLRLAQSQREPE